MTPVKSAVKPWVVHWLDTSLSLYRRAPVIIACLVLLEVLSVSSIGQVKILGLGVPGWRLADSIERGVFHKDSLERYPDGLYNFTAVLDDQKKILLYGLPVIWLLMTREVIGRSLRRLSTRRIQEVFWIHTLFAGILIGGYWYTQLYGNIHEHWIGTCRKGLFSAWSWVGAGAVSWVNIASISLYRMSYTITTALLFYTGTWALIMLSSLLFGRDERKAPTQERAWTLISESNQAYWKRQPGHGADWPVYVVSLLFVLGATAAVGIGGFALAGRMTMGQTVFGLAAVMALVLPGFIYLLRLRRPLSGKLMLVKAVVLGSLVVGAHYLYEGVSKATYRWSHSVPDLSHDAWRPLVGRLATDISSTYMESAAVMDAVRRYWEKAGKGGEEDQVAAAGVLYALWAIRLERLDQVCESPGAGTDTGATGRIMGNNEQVSLEAIVMRPGRQADQGARYRWADDVRSRGWRWRGTVIDQVGRLIEAPVGKGGVEAASAVNSEWRGIVKGDDSRFSGVHGVLLRYLQAGSLVSTPAADEQQVSTLKSLTATLIAELERDPVWLANRSFYCNDRN